MNVNDLNWFMEVSDIKSVEALRNFKNMLKSIR